jgi:hypothetical protein
MLFERQLRAFRSVEVMFLLPIKKFARERPSADVLAALLTR